MGLGGRQAVIGGVHMRCAVTKHTVVNDCSLMISGWGWDMGARFSSIIGLMPHPIG